MKKLSTGIDGLDSILGGGYPEGLPTLIKGGPGSGKTIFSQIFAHTCINQGHDVTFVTCDELPDRIIQNMDAFGLEASQAIKQKKLHLLDFSPTLSDQVVGEFELDAVLFRLKASLVGKHPVLIIDSLQNLFMTLKTDNQLMCLSMLFNWCREQKITLLITAGEGFFQDKDNYFEEYAADCVIFITQAMDKKLMTRYLRVLKYRGTSHGTNDYPFLLTQHGVSLLPITEARLNRAQEKQRLNTGIAKLDHMLGGGYLESSSVMISGESGTAKSLLAATLAHACCRAQKKVVYISYEESAVDYLTNIRSIGLDLDEFIKNKQIVLKSMRSFEMGLEEHLITMINLVQDFKADVLIIDPISSLLDMGTSSQVKSFLVRFLSYLKGKNITIILNELLKGSGEHGAISTMAISSLVDTWVQLRRDASNGEFNRTIHVVKARGSKTSNQIKEFSISAEGLSIEDPYIGRGGMLFGSAKQEKMLLDQQAHAFIQEELAEINQELEVMGTHTYAPHTQEYVKYKKFNFYLLEKKRKLERELNDIKAYLVDNKLSREA